jgi:hypothetical protein
MCGMTADDLMALADSLYDPMSPARRDPGSQVSVFPAVAITGGPVQNVPGEGPGCKGRAEGALGAATFSLPRPSAPPRFAAGENRLIGGVFPPDGPFPGSPPGPPPDPGPPSPLIP